MERRSTPKRFQHSYAIYRRSGGDAAKIRAAEIQYNLLETVAANILRAIEPKDSEGSNVCVLVEVGISFIEISRPCKVTRSGLAPSLHFYIVQACRLFDDCHRA